MLDLHANAGISLDGLQSLLPALGHLRLLDLRGTGVGAADSSEIRAACPRLLAGSDGLRLGKVEASDDEFFAPIRASFKWLSGEFRSSAHDLEIPQMQEGALQAGMGSPSGVFAPDEEQPRQPADANTGVGVVIENPILPACTTSS